MCSLENVDSVNIRQGGSVVSVCVLQLCNSRHCCGSVVFSHRQIQYRRLDLRRGVDWSHRGLISVCQSIHLQTLLLGLFYLEVSTCPASTV